MTLLSETCFSFHSEDGPALLGLDKQALEEPIEALDPLWEGDLPSRRLNVLFVARFSVRHLRRL
jgi:hypothetical protein